MSDGADLIYEGSCLVVRLLPGCQDVVDEWNKVDQKKFMQTFEAMNAEVTGPAKRWSTKRASKVATTVGGPIIEVRAPIRGKRIYRALCYQPHGYNLYMVFASEKKKQKLPPRWTGIAQGRIEDARSKGLL